VVGAEIEHGRNERAEGWALRPLAAPLPAIYSSGDVAFSGLRKLSPPNRKISEFSTRRSPIAVVMVVLNRMLPQSEKGVFVVIMLDFLRLWRVEMTWSNRFEVCCLSARIPKVVNDQ